MDAENIAFGLTNEVIIHSLGMDFWKRYSNKWDNAKLYSMIDRQHGHRMLAQLIWNARGIDGFEFWLARARNDEIEAAITELYWLARLALVFQYVGLNIPQGIRGADFDLVAGLSRDNISLNAEVKTRVEPLGSLKRARRFLDDARNQLPAGKGGAILFKVSPSETIPQTELDEAARITVANSSRLRFIGYFREFSPGPLSRITIHACVTEEGRKDDILGTITKIRTPLEFIERLTAN